MKTLSTKETATILGGMVDRGTLSSGYSNPSSIEIASIIDGMVDQGTHSSGYSDRSSIKSEQSTQS